MADEKVTALEKRRQDDGRLYSPSAARNREAIRDVFKGFLPRSGTVLEIGSGTGEHGVHLARALPDVAWRTSDPDPNSRRSIAAWVAHSGLANLSGPDDLDMTRRWWDDVSTPLNAIVSINMIHIAPFDAAAGLFTGASALVMPGGVLLLYGPFSRNGAHTAPSNEAFDASLKARDPRWGVRDLEQEIAPLAQENAFDLIDAVEMPANNFTVAFRKRREN